MAEFNKNHIMVFGAVSDFTYENRLALLRERKLEQTKWKMKHLANMDEDDYGSVPPPEDFHFEVECNDLVNKTFYGAELWSRNFSNLLKIHPIYIDLNDALCGRFMFILQRFRPFESVVSEKNLEMAPIFNYDWLRQDQERYGILPGIGKMHHFAPDYRIGLTLGWKGLREKVEHYQKINQSEESQELYKAELLALDGIDAWMRNMTDALTDLENNLAPGAVRDNVQKIRECNEWVRENPPRSFLEVCQWIAWFNMVNRTYDRAGSGCQLDEILLPYYNREIEAGTLTKEDATFILACLLLNDPVYYQIGGPHRITGKDLTNEISYLILEAIHLIKTSANVTIRYFDGLDRRLFIRGLEILMEDKQACPRFSGNKALVEGFMKNGYSAELARDRIAVGCNWMSLQGWEYTLNDLIKVNMAKVFELAFHECADAGILDTESMFEHFASHLQRAVHCIKEGIDFHMKHQYKNAPELVLNLCSHGPIEKGLDASHGGMQYYNICIDGAGIADVADSLGAMQQRIENEHVISWQQCIEAVKNNFENQEGKYVQTVLSSAGRYGSGDSLSDVWAKRVSREFTDIVTKERTPDGYITIPGLFSWANTIVFGKAVGATPNGRKASEPINQGANPHPGFRKDGAFSAMGNAIAMVQPGYGNTAPWQLELSPTIMDNDEAIENIAAVIETHFELGGTLININIMDNEKIREAYRDPSKYPDLIVRVTGFTAYFSALSPGFRKMIVDRIVTDQ
jgi:formate C-acetyltransferase